MRYLLLFFLLFAFSFSLDLKRDRTLKVVIDSANKLMWMDDPSVLKVNKSHEDAIDYCDDLNFAGYENWRLPKIEEYELIVDKNNPQSYINRAFRYNKKDGYWARKAHWRTFWFYADYMYFVSGTPYYDSRHKLKYVRCVRDTK
ncbi:hypothetical protein CRV08_09075 [Halarcobacter ebronensis]|uniref:Lcl C-terminal domain-containing protein n=1 Tax=Halarcobacter ebronensis TaxID=1462615 RepID=A0A4Q0YGQ0_9BACT|nr:DUF1566 domain-containing protein [Halarcobacter ebronensis]RXJ67951.1 hypothetical protein CRV08_09075 [Halarcobacter ebronensis]